MLRRCVRRWENASERGRLFVSLLDNFGNSGFFVTLMQAEWDIVDMLAQERSEDPEQSHK